MLSVPTSPVLPESERSEQALLPLKISAPPPRTGVLLRSDLQALLSEVRLNPVTLVTAPAGYGKTTLLSQWVQDLTRTGAPVCWLTLDSNERNPDLFLAYIIGAIQQVFPHIGGAAWRILHSAAHLERDWPLIAGALCSDLQRHLATAAFLFLDDIHMVNDSAVITQILGYFLRTAPPTLHIVIASRHTPTFAPLARLRAEGRLVEVSQRELLLSQDEIQHILATQDVTLDAEELDLLFRRTAGWVLSVQLAARVLASQPSEQRDAFVRALTGSQRQILQYLATEVMTDLPPNLLDFLCLAAFPRYFNAEILNSVLERDDVPYLLQRAQALGLPILPQDEHGDRLHFHPLWRELLLQQQPIDQQSRCALHHRFGKAFEHIGDLEAALEHYEQADDTNTLIAVLREHAWTLLRSPKRDVVRRWLERLPVAIREADPNLIHVWGMSQTSSNPDHARQVIIRAVELYRADGQFEQALRALSDLAVFHVLQLRLPEFTNVCMQSIQVAHLVRDDWSCGAARVCVAAILFSKGRNLATLRVARQAETFPLSPTWSWLLSIIVATINCRLGRPREAITTLDAALNLPLVDLDDRLLQNLMRLRALALYELGQVTEALVVAKESHDQLRNYYHNDSAGISAGQFAWLLLLDGRIDEGMIYLTQTRTALHKLGDATMLVQFQAIEVYGTFRRGQIRDACVAAESVLRRLREAEGLAPDLGTWLLLVIILGEGGEHERALASAQEIALLMEQQGYQLWLACTYLYSAYLASLCAKADLHTRLLRLGWELVATHDIHYLPTLPPIAILHVAAEALRKGLVPDAVGAVLREQIPSQALELLCGMLSEKSAFVRAHAARLLGDIGNATAYTALRPLLRDRQAVVRFAAEDAMERLVYRPSYTLHIRTLGAFTVRRGEQEIRDRDWRSSKARQLFQMLITERGRTIPRDRILDALWPNLEVEAAANNLRVTLNRLGKAVEPERPEGAPTFYIVSQADTYSFNLDSDYHFDVLDFDQAVIEGQRAEYNGHHQVAVAAYRRAAEIYRGTYLPDSLYEDWAVVERERLAMQFNDIAIRLGELLFEEGTIHEAIGLAWRVIENDQLYEEAYRLLVRAHTYLGERSTALRLYTRCVEVLRSELGIEPMPETTALYETLRNL